MSRAESGVLIGSDQSVRAGRSETSDNPSSTVPFFPVLGALAVLGVVARVAYVLTVGNHITLGLDASWYILVGKGLALGHGYSDPSLFLSHNIETPTANFPPGYPIFLAALTKLGVTGVTGLKLGGAFLGGLTTLATGVLGRRLTGRPSVGLIAAGLVAVSPSLIASDGAAMSEALAVPLTVILLLAAAWAAASGSLVRWLLVGAIAGILAMVRAEDLLFALLLVPAAILVAPSVGARRRAVQILLALLTAIGVIFPWALRNYLTFDPPILLSTNAAKGIAGDNCKSTYQGLLIGYWDFNCLDHDQLATNHEALYGQALRDEGLHYVRTHLSQVPLVVTVRVLRSWGLFNPFQEARLAQVETRSVGWQQLAWATSLAVLIVAVPGIVALRRRRLALVLTAGPVVIGTLAVVASFGNDRYVLSALPAVCIGAAVTLSDLGARGRSRARGRSHHEGSTRVEVGPA